MCPKVTPQAPILSINSTVFGIRKQRVNLRVSLAHDQKTSIRRAYLPFWKAQTEHSIDHQCQGGSSPVYKEVIENFK